MSDKAQISQTLARIPSGCCVLTAGHGDESSGMLASWVQQAAFEPPAVTVAVRHGRPVQPLIESSGAFVLNLVGEDTGPLFRHFGKGFAPGQPAFNALNTRREPEGVVLLEAIGHLRCRLIGQVDAGDHRIYVGQIVAAALHNEEQPHVHLRSNGFKY